jgi:hypothetical protein
MIQLYDNNIKPLMIQLYDNNIKPLMIQLYDKYYSSYSFDGSGDLSLIVGNNITDASHDLIISVGNNIMYLFIVH